jgi:formamidopyrimidine-DNA glycosylase
MPELPEVEAVIGMLRRDAIGATIARSEVFKIRSVRPQEPSDLSAVNGKRIESIERRGKNIVLRLSSALALRVHLRMTGILRVIPDARLYTASTRVLFTLKDRRGLAFEDRRIMGTVHAYQQTELDRKLASIGPEPLTRSFSTTYLVEAASRSKRPVKVFLMDQGIVAGLGNIYAAEALFAARIHPAKAANKIAEEGLLALHKAIRKVLRQAIQDAAKTYSKPDRHEGMHYHVYGRKGEPCHTCGKPIKTMEQGGRTTYFCAKCQRK